MVMKEQFLLLAEQANLSIATSSLWQSKVEEFGELIVQECANVLLEWKSEPFPLDPDFAAQLIKQHFGIKQ
jgi:hypothetical protein